MAGVSGVAVLGVGAGRFREASRSSEAISGRACSAIAQLIPALPLATNIIFLFRIGDVRRREPKKALARNLSWACPPYSRNRWGHECRGTVIRLSTPLCFVVPVLFH